MPVTVRRATQADAAPLAAVAALTFPLACPPHTTDEAKAAFIAEVLSEARFVEYTSDADTVVLLAEADDVAVGYTMLIFRDPYDADVVAAVRTQPTAELSKCYVHPDHHGAGVAAALMDASIDEARRRGYAALWLGVNEENAKAQRFYGKHGFERVGTKHFTVGGRIEDDYVFERAL